MQTVNVAELKTNLSDYLEQVRNGAELIIRDHNHAIARLMPLTADWDSDNEDAALVAAGLMRLPREEKSNDFFNLPEADVSLDAVRAVIRAERDED